jgi:hypothetical protein
MKFKQWFENNEHFYGVKHLENELNKLINKTLFKVEDGPHYATIDRDDERNADFVFIYTQGISTKDKIIAATKYFLQDLGVSIGKPIDVDEGVEIPIISYPRYQQNPGQWDNINPAAKMYLNKGKAIDVSDLGFEVHPGIWKLNKFIPNVDYFDSKNDKWIVRIVKDLNHDDILATTSDKLPKNSDFNTEYEIIWSR